LFLKFEKKQVIMKVLLGIKDNKSAFLMGMLTNFSYVKATTVTP